MTGKRQAPSKLPCQWAGTYATADLTPEEQAAYRAHLEAGCPVCTAVSRSFEEVMAQLGLTGDPVEPPPSLRDRLLEGIARSSSPAGSDPSRLEKAEQKAGELSWAGRFGPFFQRVQPHWFPAAAVVLICLAGWLMLRVANETGIPDRATQEAYIDSLFARVAAVIRVGLGDHVHCTVFRRFRKEPPTFEQMAKKMGPRHIALVPLVKEKVPDDFRIFVAHRCGYRGRKFIHLALKSETKLLSVVITQKNPQESFAADGLNAILHQGEIPLYQVGIEEYQVAGFETKEYLAFVVSDLEQDENLQLAVTLAPSLREFLSELTG